MKAWIPSIVLIALMLLLIAASRVYVGGPDGIEVVWKEGEISFVDSVVNVADYVGTPRAEFAAKKPALFAQMEDMGLLEPDQYKHRRRRIKKFYDIMGKPVPPGESTATPTTEPDKTESTEDPK
jgi:hypothetical protein